MDNIHHKKTSKKLSFFLMNEIKEKLKNNVKIENENPKITQEI